jgi:hypothetical protein
MAGEFVVEMDNRWRLQLGCHFAVVRAVHLYHNAIGPEKPQSARHAPKLAGTTQRQKPLKCIPLNDLPMLHGTSRTAIDRTENPRVGGSIPSLATLRQSFVDTAP